MTINHWISGYHFQTKQYPTSNGYDYQSFDLGVPHFSHIFHTKQYRSQLKMDWGEVGLSPLWTHAGGPSHQWLTEDGEISAHVMAWHFETCRFWIDFEGTFAGNPYIWLGKPWFWGTIFPSIQWFMSFWGFILASNLGVSTSDLFLLTHWIGHLGLEHHQVLVTCQARWYRLLLTPTGSQSPRLPGHGPTKC